MEWNSYKGKRKRGGNRSGFRNGDGRDMYELDVPRVVPDAEDRRQVPQEIKIRIVRVDTEYLLLLQGESFLFSGVQVGVGCPFSKPSLELSPS